jgi:hypothetical protein
MNDGRKAIHLPSDTSNNNQPPKIFGEAAQECGTRISQKKRAILVLAAAAGLGFAGGGVTGYLAYTSTLTKERNAHTATVDQLQSKITALNDENETLKSTFPVLEYAAVSLSFDALSADHSWLDPLRYAVGRLKLTADANEFPSAALLLDQKGTVVFSFSGNTISKASVNFFGQGNLPLHDIRVNEKLGIGFGTIDEDAFKRIKLRPLLEKSLHTQAPPQNDRRILFVGWVKNEELFLPSDMLLHATEGVHPVGYRPTSAEIFESTLYPCKTSDHSTRISMPGGVVVSPNGALIGLIYATDGKTHYVTPEAAWLLAYEELYPDRIPSAMKENNGRKSVQALPRECHFRLLDYKKLTPTITP